jgi:hypothetical protein
MKEDSIEKGFQWSVFNEQGSSRTCGFDYAQPPFKVFGDWITYKIWD